MTVATKFDITSDIHLDFFGHYGRDMSDKKTFLEEWNKWEPKAKNLLIAGDIGHIDQQNIDCLRWLREELYDSICFVTGNHDLYLCNEREKTSMERLSDVAIGAANLDGVHLLDGNVVDIDGVKVGGAMGWYDGSYLKNFQEDESQPIDKAKAQRLWRQTMNDSRLTTLKEFDELSSTEYDKLDNIVAQCDVVLTHINPSNHREHQAPGYVNEDTTCFYSFAGEELLKKTRAQYWLFGHTHDALDYCSHGTRVLSNPRGYPFQNTPYKLKSIEIIKI